MFSIKCMVFSSLWYSTRREWGKIIFRWCYLCEKPAFAAHTNKIKAECNKNNERKSLYWNRLSQRCQRKAHETICVFCCCCCEYTEWARVSYLSILHHLITWNSHTESHPSAPDSSPFQFQMNLLARPRLFNTDAYPLTAVACIFHPLVADRIKMRLHREYHQPSPVCDIVQMHAKSEMY